MNTPMTDEQIAEYVEKTLAHYDRDAGRLGAEGVAFLQDNIPSLEDQERVLDALNAKVKEVLASEAETTTADAELSAEVAPAEEAPQQG